MTGLDANVLLRYFAQDDAIQTPRAMAIIERRLSDANPGFVSLVTLAEVVWTLTGSYGLSNLEVATVLRNMLATDRFHLQNASQVFAATMALEDGNGFADSLIGALGQWAGCNVTLTFDKKASRLQGFELIA